MSESKNYRVALLSGGSDDWREAIMPLLFAQTDCLTVSDTVEEMLSLPPTAKPEVIFICHRPGSIDGIAAAEKIREFSPVVPLVFLAAGNLETIKAALTVGALAVLEPPFSEQSFIQAFKKCCHVVQALRLETLKQQQNNDRSELFRQSPFSHLFVNADGIVTFVNDEAAKIMGIGNSSAPEFSIISRRFFAPQGLTYPQEMEKAVQDQTAWNGILTGLLLDTSSRIYRVICVPMTLADGTLGMLLVLHDITKVQAEQAQLRITLQAARDVQKLFPESETIIEQMHVFTHDSRTPLVQEVFSVHTLLESVTATTNLTIPDYLPKYFRGDVRKLGYALKAVFDGSCRFGEGLAHLSVVIKERTSSKMAIQFNTRIENSAIPNDSYQGIADYLATAGERADFTTGLGLAAILIKQLNGTLLIRSERGRGRTVCCTVSLLPETEAFSADINLVLDEAPTPLPTLKVLVAEDNLLQQIALKHLLEDIGCQVVLVGNGKEAVDEFDDGEFDVVLMDILMPVLDGFEATRLIREKERVTGGTVPVIALTSYSLKAIQDKCVIVGMNGYLAKPVAKNKLLEALKRLSKHQELSAQTDVNESELGELPVLEPGSVLENFDYDLNIYRELVDMYLTGYATVGDQLVGKLVSDDLKDIMECAHGLKGIVANIGGLRLADAANRIQNLCREGKKPDSGLWSPLVKAEAAALKEALDQLDWVGLERLAPIHK